MMDVEIELLPPESLTDVQDALVAAYYAAYVEPPYHESLNEAGQFGKALSTYVWLPGFRFVVARLAGAVAGFACGYTSAPGQWWHDFVTRELSLEMRDPWLSDAFALVELAVIPPVQGQGIGGRLHQRILTGLPHRTAILNVLQAEIPAAQLYRTRGWVPLQTDVVYPDNPHPCTIMGLDLKQFNDRAQKAG